MTRIKIIGIAVALIFALAPSAAFAMGDKPPKEKETKTKAEMDKMINDAKKEQETQQKIRDGKIKVHKTTPVGNPNNAN